MSGFERMNTEEREPFDAYVLRQQNRALRAAVSQKRRRVHELSRALSEQRRAQQASVALVACKERHWRQLEADARLLLGQGQSGEGSDGDSKMAVDHEGQGRQGLVERALLPPGLSKLLLADVTKLAEAVAAGADPGGLDEVVKYEDEEGEGWLAGFALGPQEGEEEEGEAGEGAETKPRKRGRVKEAEAEEEEEEEELPAVDQAVQQRCAAVRALIEQLGQRLLRESSSSSSSAAAATEGTSPQAATAAALVEGQRRLQAECALLRDRLLQARRTQAELYRGLIRALKDRHRLLRPWDWGLAPPPAGENGGGGLQGMNGGVYGQGPEGGEGAASCHGEHKSTAAAQHQLAGHKRRRTEAGGAGSGGEEEGARAVGELVAELAAVKEKAAEQEALARARLEEVERVQGEKAALETRVTELIAASSSSSSNGSGGGSRFSPAPASDAQVKASALYRQTLGDRVAALAEREAVARQAQALSREVGELRQKLALAGEEKRQAVAQERAHWQPRLEGLQSEAHALKRHVGETAAEAEAGRGMRRQMDELKAALDAERAELERAREVRRQQAEEVRGLRAECASLRDRLQGAGAASSSTADAEVASLRAENERLAAFQASLLEETESLTATYEELSAAHARLKAQAEERERRQLRLQDDALRAKVGDKLQAEKVAALERRAHAAENLRRQQEEAVRALSEQLSRAQERCQAAAAERAAAEEGAEGHARAVRAAERGRAAAEEGKAAAEGRAGAMAQRAEELAGRLAAAEAERLKLQEQAGALERRLQRVQGQLDSRPAAAEAGGGGGGGGGEAASAGGMSNTVVEGMRKMLNCSVCNVRFKDTIITKCSHLFCRACVDENLKVRCFLGLGLGLGLGLPCTLA